MSAYNAYAVLMAGGVGTRFWPRSRRKSPKQVLRIFGEESLIQATYNRLSGLVDDSRLYVVTSREQKQMIHEQLPHLSEENFLLEPVGRNTAPCIGLAAIHIAAVDPEAVMIVLPADHLITEVETFRKVIRLAVDFAAQNDGLVTLGIHPTEPATGYGYIQAGEEVYREGEMPVFKVKTFAEKPNLETARRFLESGDFYWNSGMFIWKASTILQEISDKLPEIYEALQEVEAALNTPQYSEQVERMYRHIRGISIDFGVMQQAREVYVIPVEMGWNDVGSWETVYSISPKDKHLNAGEYDTLINIRSGKNYVYSPDKTVALVGVEDLIVVDTGDAILVCHKSAAQDVKEVVDELKRRGREDLL